MGTTTRGARRAMVKPSRPADQVPHDRVTDRENPMSQTPERRLAQFASSLQTRVLPDTVRHAVKRCLLDWTAATVPGGIGEPAVRLQAALAEELGHGPATLLPDGGRASTRNAALINGTAAHTIEFDDIYRPGIYHPGAPVMAAALATAQREAADGEALLRAIVAGYEVSNRIAAALVPSHYRYWHTTGTAGALGAAMAAGSLLRLDPAAMHDALGNAATMAAGLQQAFRTDAMTKPLHAGRAAEAGVLCALAANAGVSGAEQMLSGAAGLMQAMSDGPDLAEWLDDLGEYYTITGMTQKNHGCCGHTFAAIDAVLALRTKHGLTPDAVRSIRVQTYATALEVTGDWSPTTPYQAKFSLPFVVSTALAHGAVRLAAFADARLGDATIRALMTRVSIDVDADLDAAFPNLRGARVTLELADGRTVSHLAPTRRGDPDAPLSDDELDDKYRELANPVVGAEEAGRVRELIWRLESVKNCAALVPRRQAAAAAE